MLGRPRTALWQRDQAAPSGRLLSRSFVEDSTYAVVIEQGNLAVSRDVDGHPALNHKGFRVFNLKSMPAD